MSNTITKSMSAALALTLGLAVAGCEGDPGFAERGLDSVHQPIIQRDNYTLDLVSGAGGLSMSEQRRLEGWFEAMDLKYGDRIAIDDPLGSPATRDDVANVAGRYGLLLADGAPATPGYVDPGNVRVVITRSKAVVEGCPDWSDTQASNYGNRTKSGFGCGVNGNIAAMVANPEDLVRGADNAGMTTIMSSNKAIDSYRKQVPTGEKGLTEENTSEGN